MTTDRASGREDSATRPSGPVETGQYTVEQLGRRVGMSPRNIRAHQARKLLASPVRKGRLAFYDEGHARRLESIMALQRSTPVLVSLGGPAEHHDVGQTH